MSRFFLNLSAWAAAFGLLLTSETAMAASLRLNTPQGPLLGLTTDNGEVASFKIPGSDGRPSWSHSVILDGRLYLREQDKILCYDLRK
jgi:hypothetical protein